MSYPPTRPVAVLGATGLVGQLLVARLADHPWFRLDAVLASPRSAGRPYGQAAPWALAGPVPAAAAALPVEAATPAAMADLAHRGIRVVLSALDASVAGPLETAAAEAGLLVVSNAAPHRLGEDVPLVVPEVNPDHLALIDRQPWSGALVTNPNCSTIGLVLALAPLARRFGLERVELVSLQARSGAGLTGGARLDLVDDVVPHIPREEEKLALETPKLLGRLTGTGGELRIEPADLPVEATCTRVPVQDGHLLCVTVTLARPARADELRTAWSDFHGLPQELGLPSAPARPVQVLEDPARPRPRLDRDRERGMAVSVGRLRPGSARPGRSWRFVCLVHNAERGAAGAALLNAELVLAQEPAWRERAPEVPRAAPA